MTKTDISLDNPAGVLIKSTCVDYPGMVSVSFFLRGCNLSCPYCYNIDLVSSDNNSSTNFSSVTDLFNHLEKRKGIISGLTISGGEPLLNPYTPIIIKKAKSLGYKIKIDTNGTLPEKLSELINSQELKPDFIAMDIKTSPEKYSSLLCNSNSPLFEANLKKSIDLISLYPKEQREWRTVLVPGLITKDDIKNIGNLLPQNATWQFAEFSNGHCLDSNYNNLSPFTESEVKDFIEFAKSIISDSRLR